MKTKGELAFQNMQQEILKRFEKIGIKGEIGKPHLQRDHASLIVPNIKNEHKFILK